MGQSEKPPRAVWLAPLSVILGSLMTLVPVVAVVPFLPPIGLLVLLGWRLLRGDSMRVWVPVLLGLFDDMMSGQPLGSAMLLWTLCVLAIDVLDTRLVWRDFWQDWLIASGAIGFCLIAGRLVASPFGAHVDTALLLQILASAALFPLIYRLCAWFDRDVRKH
ncbi:rod shape-determining protein MreD [Sphingomonas psychrotolerans]|uniref:Rod shape-determining protein MreD n=1 Tax=Sphingomonas psychrotolerans TaxID=1327635 RepID=A0ABU3N4G3_9SPHN|nr:rod shape-determining protein MreD [Sphingomonas psychrotolerans]MDT8758401.1 rod shape-determining protein MreD [Sphingomonas psychrotolerans]